MRPGVQNALNARQEKEKGGLGPPKERPGCRRIPLCRRRSAHTNKNPRSRYDRTETGPLGAEAPNVSVPVMAGRRVALGRPDLA